MITDAPILYVALIVFIILVFFAFLFMISRYKRCPSDKILVISGRVGRGLSSKCMHGGGAFIWPLVQEYRYMSLTPLTINIPLQNALSLQNIRINVPSTFTVGISTQPEIMTVAAERMLGLNPAQIEGMAKEIIFGQLRLTVASLTIEQINQDRESFLEAVRKNVEPELNKIGLYLINVNITDITDESDYIESIGKKAASEAVNRAKVDVAQQTKLGSIGESDAKREEAIRVAENLAEAEKGKKTAMASQRIFVQQREAEAVRGENTSQAEIASSNSELEVQKASALQRAEVAKREAAKAIQLAEYETRMALLKAEEVAQQEIDKTKLEIEAEANAERTRREARGQADSIKMKYQAEAEGLQKLLEAKAAGYKELIESCNGDAQAVASLLMIEKLSDIVKAQVEAISNMKIDKITVWDGGGHNGSGNAAADFVSGFVKALPPLQEIASMAGIELPEYLGKAKPQSLATDHQETPEIS
ncbi:MAG TPA: SPFH domain-containing protein [Anaerolineaceae bacterium]|nr:SPFH domain-containing protein [Anaerolineaceae bacterium]